MKGYQTKQQNTGAQSSRKGGSSFYSAKMFDCKQFNQMKPIPRKPDSKCDDSSRETSTSDEFLDELKLNYYKPLHGKASTNDEHSDDKEQKPHKIGSFSFDPVLERLIKGDKIGTSDRVFDKDRTFGQVMSGVSKGVSLDDFTQEELNRLQNEYDEDMANTWQTNEVNFVPTRNGIENRSETIGGNIISRLLATMVTCEYFWGISEDTKHRMIDGYMSGYLTKAEKEEIGRLNLELTEMEEQAQKIVSAWDGLTPEERLGKADDAEGLSAQLLKKRQQIDARVKEIEQTHKEVNEAGKLAQKEVYFSMLERAIQDIGGYMCQLNMVDYFSVFGIREWVGSKWAFLQDVNLFLKANPQLLDLSKKEDQKFLFMISFMNTFQGAWAAAAIDLAEASFPGESTADKLELHQVGKPIKSLLIELSYLIQGLKNLGVSVPQLTVDQQQSYNHSRQERACEYFYMGGLGTSGVFKPRLMNIQQQDGTRSRQERTQAYQGERETLELKKILKSNADIIQKNMDNRDLAMMAEDIKNRIAKYWGGDGMTTDNTVHRIIGELYDIAATVQENGSANNDKNIRTRVSKLIFSFQSMINTDMDRLKGQRTADVEFFKEFLMKVFLSLPII